MAYTEADLQELYAWVDQIPLSRPKRSIARDFADGCLLSEIAKHFFPRMVELHNYSASNSVGQKLYNWNTLNQKVFKKMGFTVDKLDIDAVVNCERGAIERVLLYCKGKMLEFQESPEENLEEHVPAKSTPVVSKLIHDKKQTASSVISPPKAVKPEIHNPVKPPKLPPPKAQVAPLSQSVTNNSKTAPKSTAVMYDSIDQNILKQQEHTVSELRETVDVLQLKISKLEQLLKLKDSKIETLQTRLSRVSQ